MPKCDMVHFLSYIKKIYLYDKKKLWWDRLKDWVHLLLFNINSHTQITPTQSVISPSWEWINKKVSENLKLIGASLITNERWCERKIISNKQLILST